MVGHSSSHGITMKIPWVYVLLHSSLTVHLFFFLGGVCVGGGGVVKAEFESLDNSDWLKEINSAGIFD